MKIKPILLSFIFAIIHCIFPSKLYANNLSATQGSWPPYVFTDGQSGLSFDIVKAAFQSQGYEINLTVKPWLRSLKEVKLGSQDILVAAWWSRDRLKTLSFSTPYLLVELQLITLKESSFDYSDLNSLKGKKVGFIRNYAYGDEYYTSTHFERVYSSDLLTSIKKLKAKRVDVIFADKRAAKFLMKREGINIDDFHFIKNSSVIKPIHMAVSVHHPDRHMIMLNFLKGIHAIKTDGTYDKILLKYQ